MPVIRRFDEFLTGPFKRSLLQKYKQFQILSEGDLQSNAWLLIRRFIARYPKEDYTVHNLRYCRATHSFPDLLVFRRKRPFVVIELKEKRNLSSSVASRDWKKLEKARTKLHAKRGYLVFLGRYGVRRNLERPRGKNIFEIAISLETEFHSACRVNEWDKEFRRKAKYIDRPN